MKVTKQEDTSELVLAAVIGSDEQSYFIQVGDGSKKIYWVSESSIHLQTSQSLEEILDSPGRKPVYEGEQIVLKF